MSQRGRLPGGERQTDHRQAPWAASHSHAPWESLPGRQNALARKFFLFYFN